MKKQVAGWMAMAVTAAMLGSVASFANEAGAGGNWLEVDNRLRLEYDDNIYETKDNKTDSFKLIEEIELGITLNFEPTFLTVRYRPSFTWWSDREPDDTDLHHDLDVVLNHRFSPRVSMGLKNTFRLAEQPEEIDRGVKLRENDDYMYNVTDGNVDVAILPRTHAVVGGRYSVLRYDRDEVADTEDYDIAAGGLTIRQGVSAMSTVMADFRYEDVSYDDSLRDSDSTYYGIGLEQALGASFVGTVRGGYQDKTYNDDTIDDNSEPYGDVSLTYIVSPRTRLSLGAGYSLYEADVYPFANQERTIMFGSVAHDLTAKISLFLSASYQISDYDSSEIIDTDIEVPENYGGEENVVQGAVRVAYQLNARNSLELNYQYMDLSSDLRDDFERNRASIGWRLDI